MARPAAVRGGGSSTRPPALVPDSDDDAVLPRREAPVPRYKVCILGDTAVGKTALLNVLRGAPFTLAMTTTIGVDTHSWTYEWEEATGATRRVTLDLHDTGGQERLAPVASLLIRGSHGVVMVFDPDNRASFSNLVPWVTRIADVVDEEIPIVLVASKEDMRADPGRRSMAVSQAEAEAARLRIRARCLFNTSAKSGLNVKEAFAAMARACDAVERPPRTTLATATAASGTVSLAPEAVAATPSGFCDCLRPPPRAAAASTSASLGATAGRVSAAPAPL